MSRYFYYKPEPVDEEIKTWLAQNFALHEMNVTKRLLYLKDVIMPKFEEYLLVLKPDLLNDGLITIQIP